MDSSAPITPDDLRAARRALLSALEATSDPAAAGILLAQIDDIGERLNHLR